jgi:hypothetical protein
MADILDYLSNLLGELISTPAHSAKGLLRLSIKDAFPDKDDAQVMRLSDYHVVFSTALKSRLERVKFKNIDDVISKLTTALTNNQSLLTMMAL